MQVVEVCWSGLYGLGCMIMGLLPTARPSVWKSLAELFSKQPKGFLQFRASTGVVDDALNRDASSADRNQAAGEPSAQHCV